jgi:hypothetical protein
VLERLPRSPEDAVVQGDHGAEGDGGLLRVTSSMRRRVALSRASKSSSSARSARSRRSRNCAARVRRPRARSSGSVRDGAFWWKVVEVGGFAQPVRSLRETEPATLCGARLGSLRQGSSISGRGR